MTTGVKIDDMLSVRMVCQAVTHWRSVTHQIISIASIKKEHVLCHASVFFVVARACPASAVCRQTVIIYRSSVCAKQFSRFIGSYHGLRFFLTHALLCGRICFSGFIFCFLPDIRRIIRCKQHIIRFIGAQFICFHGLFCLLYLSRPRRRDIREDQTNAQCQCQTTSYLFHSHLYAPCLPSPFYKFIVSLIIIPHFLSACKSVFHLRITLSHHSGRSHNLQLPQPVCNRIVPAVPLLPGQFPVFPPDNYSFPLSADYTVPEYPYLTPVYCT